MRRVKEIFYSLQGEGHHTGYPSVFVRFTGCNLECDFCDTDFKEGLMMSDEQILRAINLYRADWIVLTGGEPALRIDAEFIQLLRRATGKKIAIETNGTVSLPEGIDWITYSPKNNIGGNGELPLAIDRADEIKVVDVGQDLDGYFELPCAHEQTLYYLQPCAVADPKENRENIMRTVARVFEDPRWTLSVQLHKFLGIP